MQSINLKGREIPLVYTTWEMKQVQEELGPISRALNLVMGRNPEDEDDQSWFGSAEHIRTITAMARILGNAALEEMGEKPDLTDKMIRRMMRPDQIGEMVNAVLDAMAEGMQSEIPKEVKTGPVDVTLEEIEKKKETES